MFPSGNRAIFRLDELGILFDGDTFRGATGVANEGWMRLVGGGEHHIHQLILVFGRHGDDVGHTTEVGDIEKAVVGGPVLGRETCAVHAKDHWQILERGIVQNAIEGSLEEG